MKIWKKMEKKKFGKMEIWNNGNSQMDIWKNRNLEKMIIWKNRNLEKQKFGKS